MVQTILPTESYEQKMFACPNCNWPHWFTLGQLQKNNIVINCDCGLTLRPRLNEESKSKKKDKNKLLSNRNVQLAIMVLEGRMSKQQANDAVFAVFDEFKELEQLIKDAIDYVR